MEKKVITLDLTGCKYLGKLHERIRAAFDFPTSKTCCSYDEHSRSRFLNKFSVYRGDQNESGSLKPLGPKKQ